MVKQPVVHGGQIYQVAKALGRSVDSFVDFSASINPLGPPTSVLYAIQQALPACGQYPDPSAEALCRRLAKEHGIPRGSIVVGNGSAELIRVLPLALALREGYVMGPTFMEYEESLHVAGARCTYVLAQSAERYSPPMESLLRLVDMLNSDHQRNKPQGSGPSTAVFICNPNSPTGRVVSVQNLQKLYRQVEQAGLWMVVDETFIDFCLSYSLIKIISHSPRLLILRSFTKFYGIPGIRLGYLVGSPDIIAIVRRLLPPWSVSHFAQVAGVAAVDDLPYRQRSVKFMQQERNRFMTRLRTIQGLRVIPSSANFVMVELPSGCETEKVVAQLAHRGFLVRDCRTFTGISQSSLRFAIRHPGENDGLIHALREVCFGKIARNKTSTVSRKTNRNMKD